MALVEFSEDWAKADAIDSNRARKKGRIRLFIWPAMVSPLVRGFQEGSSRSVIPITTAGTSRHTGNGQKSGTLIHLPMNEFGVLTNRRRALIALIHSLVFLGVAMHGFLSPKAGILRGSASLADLILIAIYLVVASILLWLTGISRGAMERIYFALCAGSATSGLLRTIFGDSAIPAAQYIRVLLLSSAVAICILIVRVFLRPLVPDILSE